ncbi:MAG: NUDIX hydrolase N-terminal domain-containing protein [Chloroflexota bacterium]
MANPDLAALRELADELRAIAGFGLNFSRTPYDAERYEHVLGVAARLSALIDDAPC